jgi:4-methyl-5(b-hydroxyethyl)-thiazole monophosphate biosynthesis
MNKVPIVNKVLLLLADGFELIETSGFTDVFAWASFQQEVHITVTCAAIHTQVTPAFGGITVQVNAQLKDLDLSTFDALAIPGGMEWAGFFKDAYSEEFKQVIRHFANHHKPIAAVCVASLSLAAANVLKHKKATVYHSSNGKHKTTLEQNGVIFVDSPVMKDGNITTSTGPGTAVEVALALLADLTDEQTVQNTRDMMRIPSPDANWYAPQIQ